MHIKAKLYPYPVLTDFNDDYVDSNFDMDVSIEKSPTKIRLSINTILENEGIKNLIKENLAKYCLHIECPLTSFREMVLFEEENKEIEISADKIEGVLNLCPLIIAVKDIENYTNDKFNSMYDGIAFDLEKGNFIAFGKEIQVRIEKESDNLSNVPSIFAVTEIKDTTRTDIVIDNSGNKINIQLPSTTFYEFKLASLNPNSMTILHSVLIIPALMKCFEELKARKEEIYLFEDRRWFRAIKKALSNHGIVLDEDSIVGLDSFDVAQKLMDSTTNRALLGINNIAFKGDSLDD